MAILQEVFGESGNKDNDNVRSILGIVVIAANLLSPSAITKLLVLDTKVVLPILLLIQPLLILNDSYPDYPA